MPVVATVGLVEGQPPPPLPSGIQLAKKWRVPKRGVALNCKGRSPGASASFLLEKGNAIYIPDGRPASRSKGQNLNPAAHSAAMRRWV